MATVDCQRCGHLGHVWHYDGPCTYPDCACQRLVVPISSTRYQQLLDWLHEGKDITNINGDDLPSILLSYEQVVNGLFGMRAALKAVSTRQDLYGLDVVDGYREEILATFEDQLRAIFGVEED